MDLSRRFGDELHICQIIRRLPLIALSMPASYVLVNFIPGDFSREPRLANRWRQR